MRAEVSCSWLHTDKQEVSDRTSSTSACRSLLLQRKATAGWLLRSYNFLRISPARFFSALGPLRQQHHAQFCQLHGSELQHPRAPVPVQKEEYKYPCTLHVINCYRLRLVAPLVNLMCLSMVCPTWHTWGRCWRKKGNLALESSPRGWYLVGIVKTSRKYTNSPWAWWPLSQMIYIRVPLKLHIYILFYYVKVSLENSTDTHISLSHTHCAQEGDMGYL